MAALHNVSAPDKLHPAASSGGMKFVLLYPTIPVQWSGYRLIWKPTTVLSAYTRNMRTSVIPAGIASYSLERFAARVCASITRRNSGVKLPLLATALVPNDGGPRSSHRLLTNAA